MPPDRDTSSSLRPAALPGTFREYLRSFGPGIVVVLTWLGAGDIVDAGVSGGNYGYALMWVIALALVVRCLFVSLIAKYQLCNQHQEGVLDGLVRLHPWYAPFLAITSIVMGHVYCSYMIVGAGETWVKLSGLGAGSDWGVFCWGAVWSGVALVLVFHPVYQRVEIVFKLMLALLAASLLGTAAWVGPSWSGIVRGTLAFELPAQKGPFGSMLIAVSLLGAIGGSLMNLAYPYFLEQKGWKGPKFRRLQMYDLTLAVVVMIVLNLAVWSLGAELIYARGQQIKDLNGLAELLGSVLGGHGRVLFYLGVFAAVFTSLVGISMTVGFLASHSYLRWRAGSQPLAVDYRDFPLYRIVVAWALVSPIVWTLPGMPDFVTLTLFANALQVVLIPVLAGGLWWITASARFIGPEYRNRWWENAVMAFVFIFAIWAVGSLFWSFVTGSA